MESFGHGSLQCGGWGWDCANMQGPQDAWALGLLLFLQDDSMQGMTIARAFDVSGVKDTHRSTEPCSLDRRPGLLRCTCLTHTG